jgi:hypothetical protein
VQENRYAKTIATVAAATALSRTILGSVASGPIRTGEPLVDGLRRPDLISRPCLRHSTDFLKRMMLMASNATANAAMGAIWRQSTSMPTPLR